MEEIQVQFSSDESGAFIIPGNEKNAGEMTFKIHGDKMVVYHTEVDDSLKGSGAAKALLEKMVAYARARKLTVIPKCPYVRVQFMRHPEQYADISRNDAES